MSKILGIKTCSYSRKIWDLSFGIGFLNIHPSVIGNITQELVDVFLDKYRYIDILSVFQIKYRYFYYDIDTLSLNDISLDLNPGKIAF